jgi:hypothetical protein
MPMAPLALPPARPRKFMGANNVQRCTGALVGALMGALVLDGRLDGCLVVHFLIGRRKITRSQQQRSSNEEEIRTAARMRNKFASL